MNNLNNCKKCKKIFHHKNSGVKEMEQYCPNCIKIMLNDISKLSSIVNSNTNITLEELSIQTSVSENMIKKYIANGKVPVIDEYKVHRCKRCATHIKLNGYCNKCMKILKLN